MVGVLDWIYPPKCALCGQLGPLLDCETCRPEFEIEPHQQDLATSFGGLSVWSAFEYEGRPAQAVRRLKYERATSLAAPLALWLGEAIREFGLEPDAVAPVPIHWRRRWERGFNQSDLLAEKLRGYRPELLERTRFTRPQVGLSRKRRQENLRGAFRAPLALNGERVLLIDDVVTTGSTLVECAHALRKAGASDVVALTLCVDRLSH